jgi:S-DNA-T family DNA segregation ATPase FtsK/SpoIIIE
MSACAECGFTYGVLARQEIAPTMETLGEEVAARLRERPERLTARRHHEEWSPLEYACHVRDVLLMQRDRLFVALVEDEPSFKPMYREQRVTFDRYNQQPPAVVADQLVMAAALAAHAFSGLKNVQWDRPLIYNFPEPKRRDVEWVGHHTLHEMTHHLADIDRILGTG